MPSKIKKNIFKRVFSTFFIFSLVAFCVSAVLLVPYAWHLNKTIKSKFDGRRWAIPARVYARPLELYSGKKIDKFSLEKELRFAGYRQDVSLQHSGSFYIKDSSFQLVTREFDFGDGIEPSKSISVTFSGDTIADIEEQNSYKSQI